MSKKIIYLLLAVSIGLNIGVIGTTLIHRTVGPPPDQGPRPEGGPGQPPAPGQMVEMQLRRMTQHLDLDAQQQEAIRSIMETHMEQLSVLKVAADKADRDLSEAYGAPVFDTEQFNRLVHLASINRSRRDSLSSAMLVAEAEILTPRQRLKFSKIATTIYTNQGPPRPEGRDPRRNGGPPPRGR